MSGIDDARSQLEGDFSVEALAGVIPVDWIRDALSGIEGRAFKGRSLSAPFVVWFVVLLGLFRRTSYENLLERLAGSWWGRRLWKRRPKGSGITKARDRVGVQPLRNLFERTARVWTGGNSGEIVNGRRVFALDGLTYKLPDSLANRAYFGLPAASRGRSAFPQMRAMHLMDLGTRIVRDVVLGPYSDGEITLVKRLLPRVPVGSVLLMDRGFVAFDLMFQLHNDCHSDFIVRGKTWVKATLVKVLSAGDEIVDVRVPRSARGRDRRLPPVWRMRRITFEREGCKNPLVLLTTILDAEVFPKEELVQLYLRRWEIETSNGEIKTYLAECATVNHPTPLRSKTPDRVLQELYGMLIAYNAVRRLTCESGQAHDVDPLRVSFVASLQRVREAVHDMTRVPSTELAARYAELLHSISRIRVPRRPGRKVPREVKVKMSKYPVKKYGVAAA